MRRVEPFNLYPSSQWLCVWRPICTYCVPICCEFDQSGTSISECVFLPKWCNQWFCSLTVPANDEFDLVKAWQGLAQKHNIRLETCVAAALRRGVVSQDEANQHNLMQNNLAEGFEQAGLGSLAEAMLTQDRVVQF